jgi:hypothetical protein
MPNATEHQTQQALLQALRNNAEPGSQEAAQALAKSHHDREMAGLSDDVYDSAMGIGKPPAGWLRGSENLDALRAAAPKLTEMSDRELTQLMKPNNSGFRAEVYLPDPAVLGPGYKPSIVYKGSAGEVLTDRGLRDTTKEDFLANNFPQQIGQKTDYYDRAMRIATQMQNRGLDFELSGHSLGGGMASAGSAVSGKSATTFNSAALNPATAARFAQENPGVQVYSTEKIVTGYQVAGELVNDGIQNNIDRLDLTRKAQLGGVLRETAHLLREVPEGATLLKSAMNQEGMPAYAQPALNKFVDALATNDTEKMVRDLPLAAGTLQPVLAAKTRVDPSDPNSPLMDRAQIISLQEASNFAGPVLETMRTAAKRAHLGHEGGEVVAAGGRLVQQRLDSDGDGLREVSAKAATMQHTLTSTAGDVAAAGVRKLGDGAAYVRTEAAEFVAEGQLRQGQVQQFAADKGADALRGVGSAMPAGIANWLDRKADGLEKFGDDVMRSNQAEASAALTAGQRHSAALQDTARVVELQTVVVTGTAADVQDAGTRRVGEGVDTGLDAAGAALRNTTDKAPALGAAAGGAAAVALDTVFRYGPSVNPAHVDNITKAAAFAASIGPGWNEAEQRHGMKTVVPSLDARIDQQEAAARAMLTPKKEVSPAAMSAPAESASPTAIKESAALQLNDPRHGDYRLYNQIFGLVKEHDIKIGRSPDQLSEQLTAALTVAAKAEGMKEVHHLMINNDRGRAFVVDTPDAKAEWRQRTFVELNEATQQPIAQSSEKMIQVNQTLAMQVNNDNTLQPSRGGPSMG